METSSARAKNINSQSGTRRSCASSFRQRARADAPALQLKFLCQNRLRPALLHSKPLHLRANHIQSELHPRPTLGTIRPGPDSHMGMKLPPSHPAQCADFRLQVLPRPLKVLCSALDVRCWMLDVPAFPPSLFISLRSLRSLPFPPSRHCRGAGVVLGCTHEQS